MGKISWDDAGKRFFETGVKNGVLYLRNADGSYGGTSSGESTHYPAGVAWNGLSTVTETPSGAEANPIYADDMKYLNLYSVEEFGLTVEAYTYPDEFMACDGTSEIEEGTGAYLGQQARKVFGLCYKTTIGNDVSGNDAGYKLHLVYGCQASPSERAYSTINDSPEAITFSWEVSTTPVNVSIEGKDFKPTSIITIDSTKANETKLKALEKKLYGADATTDPVAAEAFAYLPLPEEVLSTLSAT